MSNTLPFAPHKHIHPHTCTCTDIINSQLRSREVDLSEAQRVAAAAQAEAAVLRSQLAAAKQAAAADAAAAEARLASKDAEVRLHDYSAPRHHQQMTVLHANCALPAYSCLTQGHRASPEPPHRTSPLD